MKHCLLTLLLCTCGLAQLSAQNADCPYPVVFVHGWGGSELTWQDMATELQTVWGDDLHIPGLDGADVNQSSVYYANLNWQYDESHIWGANRTPNGLASYVDDDVILHEQFANSPTLLTGKCVYAVSFFTRKDTLDTAPTLVTKFSSQWDFSAPRQGESSSSEASAFKQGYALGKAIDAIRVASGKDKVILVAHSMGGLAAREYLQRKVSNQHPWWVEPLAPDGHKVAKLLTVGSPHRGSNSGNSVADNVYLRNKFLSFGMDLRSEAVRDLRYFYNVESADQPVVNNSAYLYGNSEDLIVNDPPFYTNDVDCNGTALESIEGINESGLAVQRPNPWDGTKPNPSMAMPSDVKVSYYVSDQVKLFEDHAAAIGDIPDEPNWFQLARAFAPAAGSAVVDFNPTESDGIVEADRQWLFTGGNGSTSHFTSGTSVCEPFNREANFQSDRITTPHVSGHVAELDQSFFDITTSQTQDFDQVARGIDEGDYPIFAAQVELNEWYAGTPNLRADVVPTSSTYTGTADNKIDGDWYRVHLTEPAGKLVIEVEVDETIDLTTRLDIYGGAPTDLYANDEDGIISVTRYFGNLATFDREIQSCELQQNNDIYFRITSDLNALDEPEEAWRKPYKFKVATTPALYADGTCPSSTECPATFSSYGSSGCDENCDDRYDGANGNIRIPIHFVTAGDAAMVSNAVFETQLASINTWAQNIAGLNWSFYRASTTNVPGDAYDSYDYTTLSQVDADILRAETLNNPDALVVFAVDDYNSGGVAGYPLGNPLPTIDGSNWALVDAELIRNNQWPVLAHEFGHLFGLFHTFACQAFPEYNLCASGCRSGDGIADTPFDPAPYTGTEPQPNFMSYDTLSLTTIPNFFPAITATPCQAAKMNDLLYNCRNNLGLQLETPQLTDKRTGILAPQFFNSSYRNPLDTLVVTLQGEHFGNDGGFAHWTFTKPNGTTFELWADTLDLNTLYTQGKIDRPGAYGVSVRDRRIYNEAQQSEPLTFLIQLDACNTNTICEPWETSTDCSDCQFGTNNYTLDRVEYYLDVDPGYGLATPISNVTGNNIELDFNIDLSNTSPGIHTLYVRARDDAGNWSFTQRRLFYVYDAPGGAVDQLSRLEYYIDSDPGYGQATALALTDVTNSEGDYNISLTDVAPGIHTLYVRAQNSAGRWSFTQRRLFYVFEGTGTGESTLQRLEYYLDDDPGFGLGAALALNDPYDSDGNYTIDLASVSPGIHTLYVRAQDNNGRWSFVQRRLFYVFDGPGSANNELERLEYFIDEDPGFGAGVELPLADVTNSQADYTIDLTTTTPGIHTIYVRARDTRGRWSFVQRRLFYVYDAPGGPREIVKVEYFVDGPAPGYGSAQNVPITPNDSIDVNFTVPTGGLNGNHILYVRAQDNYGRWSFTVSDTLIWSDKAIEVLSPNGGTYTAGLDAISGINWDTTNSVGNVDIWLIKPNGLHIAQIATNVDQGGPWPGSWDIPVWVNAGDYRIKVNARSEPSILGYSTTAFRINSPNGTFCDGFTDLVAASAERDAASCLCEKGMVQPKYYNSFNTYGVNAEALLERADLAKLTYLLVHGPDYTSPAADFKVPYADLQTNNADYFVYVRDLLFLQYGDKVTPYDRDFINFRPFEPIQSRYALKVLLEALDIAPDGSGPSPYANIGPSDDAYGYVKAAADRGWLPANFDAYAELVRGDAFVILKNIIDGLNLDCQVGSAAKLSQVTIADYAVPGNFTPMNQGRSVDMAEGYFPSFFKSSFSFPGIGMPLTYGHGYYGHHAEQPERFRPLDPLGEAWSHSFNTYIVEEVGWSTSQLNFADKVYVNWGSGSLNCYDKATLKPETHGVYSTLVRQGEERYIIRSKAQISYGFTRYTLDAGTNRNVWMLTDITDRNNNRITITIDDSGARPRVQSVVGTGGFQLDFGYDANGKLATVTDVAGGRVIGYTVDANNNLSSFTNAKGDVTTFDYGSVPTNHLLHGVQLPEGNGITNTYGEDGRLETTKINGQSTATQISAAYNYTQTATPLVSTVTDTDGKITTKSYNTDGYLNDYSKDGDDLAIVYDTDDPSLPKNITTNGQTVGTTYDDAGNPLTITLPLGVVHRYTYNSKNDPVTYTNPRGKVTRFEYDNNGNVERVIDPNNNVTTTRFNSQGQLLLVKTAENVQFVNTYNSNGTLASSTGPENIYQSFDYDAVGRRDFTENANGQVTVFSHDELDQMVSMTREGMNGDENIVTQYRFNGNMLLDSIINAHGDATTFDYNDQNQPIKVQFGDDADEMEYDEDGKLDFTTIPTGDVLDRTYDNRDRMTFNGYATITYDDRDNPETFTHAGRTTTLTYDDLDRPKTATYDGRTIAYDYDANGNTTGCTYADGTLITKTYDNGDRLSQVKLGTTILVSYTYRKDNLIDRITYGNGTYCDHTYDSAARLTGKTWYKSNGEVFISYDITLDGVGNHLNVDAVEPFGPPALLPAMYTATYNSENEPTTVDGQTYTFDALGTQTSAAGTNYAWNEHEQLLSVGTTLTYMYDGQKLRRMRVADDGVWEYDWDVRGMGNVLTDYLEGDARYHYVYGAGMVCRIDVSSGAVSYFHGDVRGSVIAITDNSQVVTHAYQYGPFGEVLQQLETDFNPFQYVGQYGLMQEGGGLYYVRARYMDSWQGRFISEDPIWHDNLYPYAANNPMTLIDVSGKCPEGNDYSSSRGYGPYCSRQDAWKGNYEIYKNFAKLLGKAARSYLANLFSWGNSEGNNNVNDDVVPDLVLDAIVLTEDYKILVEDYSSDDHVEATNRTMSRIEAIVNRRHELIYERDNASDTDEFNRLNSHVKTSNDLIKNLTEIANYHRRRI